MTEMSPCCLFLFQSACYNESSAKRDIREGGIDYRRRHELSLIRFCPFGHSGRLSEGVWGRVANASPTRHRYPRRVVHTGAGATTIRLRPFVTSWTHEGWYPNQCYTLRASWQSSIAPFDLFFFFLTVAISIIARSHFPYSYLKFSTFLLLCLFYFIYFLFFVLFVLSNVSVHLMVFYKSCQSRHSSRKV